MGVGMDMAAAAGAAILSYGLNGLLTGRMGMMVAGPLSPVVEETLKTMPAYYLGADIAVVHVLFGVIEGSADWLRGGRSTWLPAAASVIGHGLFGWLTVKVAGWTGGIFGGWMSACLLHMIWNIAVLRMLPAERDGRQ